MESWINAAATLALSASSALLIAGCVGGASNEADAMDPASPAADPANVANVETSNKADKDANRAENTGEAHQPCFGGFGLGNCCGCGFGIPAFALGWGCGGFGFPGFGGWW
jgi:hypothetical protein